MFGKKSKNFELIQDKGMGYSAGFLIENTEDIKSISLLVVNEKSPSSEIAIGVLFKDDSVVVLANKNFNFTDKSTIAVSRKLLKTIISEFWDVAVVSMGTVDSRRDLSRRFFGFDTNNGWILIPSIISHLLDKMAYTLNENDVKNEFFPKDGFIENIRKSRLEDDFKDDAEAS